MNSYYDGMRRLEEQLEDTNLPHTSASVRRAFTCAAAHCQHDDGIDQYVTRYRTLAAMVERAQDVVEEVAGRRTRAHEQRADRIVFGAWTGPLEAPLLGQDAVGAGDNNCPDQYDDCSG